jgi:hypothetical protein
MYQHHNSEIYRPLMDQLIETFDEKWENTSYGNDSMASIGYETLEEEWIIIYIPNAAECDPSKEEHSTFIVNVCDKYFVEFENIDEVIEAFKNGVGEFYEVTEATERKAVAEVY